MAKQLRIFLFFSLTICLLPSVLSLFLSGCTIFKWTIPKKEETKPSKIIFIWPVKGEINSGFGKRNGEFHQGIDIKANEGSEIRAAADGIVSYADFRPTYGNVIIILHKNGFATVYAHNKKNLVSASQRVKQGDVIALVGKTGNATGFHLHFEIRNKGKAENPLIYLQSLK
ncbi:MAG: M23 family metallopeptidase [bacterium]